jgi:hypothetical protein
MNKHRTAALLRELADHPEALRRVADEIEREETDEPQPRRPRARAVRQREIRRVDTTGVTDLDRERAARSLRRAGARR